MCIYFFLGGGYGTRKNPFNGMTEVVQPGWNAFPLERDDNGKLTPRAKKIRRDLVDSPLVKEVKSLKDWDEEHGVDRNSTMMALTTDEIAAKKALGYDVSYFTELGREHQRKIDAKVEETLDDEDKKALGLKGKIEKYTGGRRGAKKEKEDEKKEE